MCLHCLFIWKFNTLAVFLTIVTSTLLESPEKWIDYSDCIGLLFQFTCADPESLFRGGPTLTFLVARESK